MTALEVTKQFFDQKAAGWDYHFNPQKRNQLSTIISEILPDLSGPVLDIGSGNGILLDVLPAYLKIIELDLSKAMLSEAKNKQIPASTEFLQGDGHYLPFKNESFATAFCFQALPHFQCTSMIINEVERILQSGGLWIILHLMDHSQLNDLHCRAGREVCEDVLRPAKELSWEIQSHNFKILECVEKTDLYLIIAQKNCHAKIVEGSNLIR